MNEVLQFLFIVGAFAFMSATSLFIFDKSDDDIRTDEHEIERSYTYAYHKNHTDHSFRNM